MSGQGDKIWLSHSGIDILYRCPRCFWLRYNRKIYQPEGIVSRLPDRFDRIIKKYFDKFRISNELPPLIQDKLEGRLQNPFQEKYFALVDEKYGFLGKLDECLIDQEGRHIPVDFKTASSDPKTKETFAAYQNQIDEYELLLKTNNKKTAGFGYLIYFYPKESDSLHQGFPIDIHIQKIATNTQSAVKRIKEAVGVLEGSLPDHSPECPFCSWHEKIKTII